MLAKTKKDKLKPKHATNIVLRFFLSVCGSSRWVFEYSRTVVQKCFKSTPPDGAPRSGSFNSGARSFKSLPEVRRRCGTAERVFESWRTLFKSLKSSACATRLAATIESMQHGCSEVLRKHILRHFLLSVAILAQILQLSLVLLFHVAFTTMKSLPMKKFGGRMSTSRSRR